MLTAAITSPLYFVFGPAARPGELALPHLGTPEHLTPSCDSAYPLLYCCLPLYDRVKVTPVLELMLKGCPAFTDPASRPAGETYPGMELLKELVDRGVAEFDPMLDDIKLKRAVTIPPEVRDAIRREFITPELVEVILDYLPQLELDFEDAVSWVCDLPDGAIPEVAAQIAEAWRVGRPPRDDDADVYGAVGEVLDHLAGLCTYAMSSGHDVYAFKYFMPLLLAHAVQDRLNLAGLRSVSLVLPGLARPEDYWRAFDSFAPLRRELEQYQRVVSGGDEGAITEAYRRVDDARLDALKAEFDGEARRDIVTVTALLTAIRGQSLRHFLPDDHFRLSLALQHCRYMDTDQMRAFELLLDAVLLGFMDLGVDGSTRRTLLASCACQPLLDFVVLSQCQRLRLDVDTGNRRMLGHRWGAITEEIGRLGGHVGGPLAYLGRIVLGRRNALAHPAGHPGDLARPRGEALADLCRLADFIRFLDCTIPPTG
jgi:hypothetical protein